MEFLETKSSKLKMYYNVTFQVIAIKIDEINMLDLNISNTASIAFMLHLKAHQMTGAISPKGFNKYQSEHGKTSSGKKLSPSSCLT